MSRYAGLFFCIGTNMDYLYGLKLNQTQGYTPEGLRVALTRIKVDPCWLIAKKENGMMQVAFGTKKHPSSPLLGMLKNLTTKITPKYVKEIKITNEIQEKVTVGDVFNAGDKIKVSGEIKGKGFQGVMRRHGFKGAPKTHGTSTVQRHPGSIGQTTTPGRVYKGKKMAGHMGTTMVSIKGLEVFEVKPEENLLVVKGLVPGGKNTLLRITKLPDTRKKQND